MPAFNAVQAAPAKFDASQRRRRSMLAKVHIAIKDLRMAEDDYQQIVFDKTGKTSLEGATEAQIGKVLDVMKAKGFKPLPGKNKVATHPMALKARAMWESLYHLGAIRNPAYEALEGWACQRLGCAKLQWARQSDATRIIEPLKDWAKREGWLQHNPATGRALSPIELRASLCSAILLKLKDEGVVPGDWLLHHAAWQLCGIENAKADPWTASDYDRLAAALGDRLRAHKAATGGARG
ncbi:MAG: regulatory protein GemA [Novosphingobium sp.]|nr:regulatory protein GemA [Novosphingobium sp.]